VPDCCVIVLADLENGQELAHLLGWMGLDIRSKAAHREYCTALLSLCGPTDPTVSCDPTNLCHVFSRVGIFVRFSSGHTSSAQDAARV
jgi:hypothetical protein